ncbi:MAG: hypothetical protein LC745_01105 [Planctomycetia bacterium]|nr:hypothetical protein [Planctomycetia bacterium]
MLSASSAFPATAHVRLAHAITGPSTVQAVVDERVGSKTCGTGLGFVLKGGDSVTGTLSLVSATSGAPTLVVDPNGPAVGFFGATPASQAAAMAPVTDNSTGSVSNTIADVGPAFSQAQIDANFATLAAKVNALIAALKRHGLMSN